MLLDGLTMKSLMTSLVSVVTVSQSLTVNSKVYDIPISINSIFVFLYYSYCIWPDCHCCLSGSSAACQFALLCGAMKFVLHLTHTMIHRVD